MTPLLISLAAPSGCGKNVLADYALSIFPDFIYSISHTTRKPRKEEINNIDYYFVTKTKFKNMIKQNKFAEWAEVHGNLYGTSKEELERCEKLNKSGIIFILDYKGVRQLKATWPEAIGIFILPPTMQTLKNRLKSRGLDSKKDVELRFHNAKLEIENYSFFDYIMINDNFNTACEELKSIIIAERLRKWRMSLFAEKLIRTNT